MAVIHVPCCVGLCGHGLGQLRVHRAAEHRPGPGRHGAADEAVHPFQVLPGDVRPDIGGVVARVALA